MTKYVIDLPAAENATVEKRVIELPADEIKLLVEHKRRRSIFGFLNYLINETGDPSLITELTDELGTAYISITQDVLAEWYLGHVEFVPKNGPKFYIRVVDVFDADGNDLYLASMGNNEFMMTIYTDRAGMFTEEEADNIIADVSNSDVSLTARKVKVEEK